MRRAAVSVHDQLAGYLEEIEPGRRYRFSYVEGYAGPGVSLTMPVHTAPYDYERFPAFFEGLLPEGGQLEGLLKQAKLDRNDYFGQLVAVGADLVGAVTVKSVAAK